MALVFFFFFLIVSTAYGAESSSLKSQISEQTCKIKINALIDSALRTHPSIQASQHLIQSSNAQVEGAKWNYFPSPSIDVSMASGRRGTTLRLDQPLWTGGKLDAAYDLALSRKDESEITLEENGYTLADTLLTLVQNHLKSQENLQALEEGKAQLEEFEQMLQRRIDAGVSSIADRELIRSRLAQISADIATTLSRRNTARAQIELLSGKPLECGIEYTDTAILNRNGSINSMRTQMIDSHPSVKKLTALIRTAQAEKERTLSAPWPNVSLRAEHQSGSVYTDQSSTNNLLYVAVSMSPGAGLSAISAIQSAQSKVLQAEYDKRAKEQDLTDALIRDFDEYHAARERINGMEQTIEASRNVLDSYTRLFIAGKRQWLDLVNASRELTQNSVALADLKASLIISAYRLALKCGEIPLDSGEKQ